MLSKWAQMAIKRVLVTLGTVPLMLKRRTNFEPNDFVKKRINAKNDFTHTRSRIESSTGYAHYDRHL